MSQIRSHRRQLGFELALPPALGRGDFLAAPSNTLALAMIEAPSGLPGGRALIFGPEGAGKTHLAAIWAARMRAGWLPSRELCDALPALLSEDAPRPLVLEDADRLTGPEAEEALFHLLNHRQSRKAPLLITARTAPRDWGLKLPDLASRLQASALARLEPPDDALLAAVLVKLFTDRQILPAPELIDYLLPRIERSFAAASAIAARLDAEGLRLHRSVNRALAQALLADRPGTAQTAADGTD